MNRKQTLEELSKTVKWQTENTNCKEKFSTKCMRKWGTAIINRISYLNVLVWNYKMSRYPPLKQNYIHGVKHRISNLVFCYWHLKQLYFVAMEILKYSSTCCLRTSNGPLTVFSRIKYDEIFTGYGGMWELDTFAPLPLTSHWFSFVNAFLSSTPKSRQIYTIFTKSGLVVQCFLQKCSLLPCPDL